jgi:hypothetical protein
MPKQRLRGNRTSKRRDSHQQSSCAAAGKDYQLWAVDAEHKDPISAGLFA